MKEMYKGKVNSPATLLVETIDSSVTSIKVADGTVFPEGPNVAVIGTDGNAETIKYDSINGNILVGCVRGFQGKASVWDKDTIIARNFTEYDLDALQENILELDKNGEDYAKKSELNSIAEEMSVSISDIRTLLRKDINNKIDKSKITDDYGDTSSDLVLSQKGANDLWVKSNEIIKTKYMECIESIQLTESVVNSKASQDDIPTKLSDLTNDKTFKTEAEIQELINNSTKLKKEVVTSLPTTGKDDVIYLVKDAKGKDNNNYLEYLWLNDKYELIGSTQVDLSGYVTKEEAQKNETTLRNDFAGLTGYVEEKMDVLSQDVQEELDRMLLKTDIQEFTKQELEEAFK